MARTRAHTHTHTRFCCCCWGIELRASYTLGECSTTELYTTSLLKLYFCVPAMASYPRTHRPPGNTYCHLQNESHPLCALGPSALLHGVPVVCGAPAPSLTADRRLGTWATVARPSPWLPSFIVYSWSGRRLDYSENDNAWMRLRLDLLINPDQVSVSSRAGAGMSPTLGWARLRSAAGLPDRPH